MDARGKTVAAISHSHSARLKIPFDHALCPANPSETGSPLWRMQKTAKGRRTISTRVDKAEFLSPFRRTKESPSEIRPSIRFHYFFLVPTEVWLRNRSPTAQFVGEPRSRYIYVYTLAWCRLASNKMALYKALTARFRRLTYSIFTKRFDEFSFRDILTIRSYYAEVVSHPYYAQCCVAPQQEC